MARIEVDPNYTSPTFSRATAAADIFKKEDVQNVSAAFSTHDHSSGKGLAVTRLDTLNQDITLSKPFPKLLPNGALVVQNNNPNQNSDVYVLPNGSSTTAQINVFSSPDTANATIATLGQQSSATLLICGKSGSGVYGPFFVYTSATEALRIMPDHSAGFAGYVTLSGGAISLGNFTGNVGMFCNGNLAFGTDTTHAYIVQSANNMYFRAAAFSFIFQNIDGSGPGNIDAGAVQAHNHLTVGDTVITGQQGDLQIRKAVDGSAHIYFADSSHQLYVTGGGAITSSVSFQSAGSICAYSAANFSWGFNAPNIANGTGQGMANAWNVYSSRDFKSAVAPISDPLAIVMDDTLHGVSYNHVGPSGVAGEDGLTKEGQEITIVETPSIGFISDDWLPHVPEVVSVDEDGKPVGMDYARVGAITFEALKEYIAQTDARLAALEGAPA